MDTTYNGWTNYETWNVNLWMDNERGSSELWNEHAQACYDATDQDDETSTRQSDASEALANELEAMHDEYLAALNLQGCFADIMGAAMSRVDWREIADNLLSGIGQDSAT
jgi:hypothetical protein